MVLNVLVVVCWPKKSFIYMVNSAEMIEFIWDSWTEFWKKKEKKTKLERMSGNVGPVLKLISF